MTARRAANASAGVISGLTAAFTSFGHVLDLLQHVQFQVGALQLVACVSAHRSHRCRGPFARLLSFCSESAATWWLVTSSPSGETNPPEPPLLKRTDARMALFEPGVGEVEAVLLLEEFAGRIVEQPHALVRNRRHCCPSGHQNRQHEVLISHGTHPMIVAIESLLFYGVASVATQAHCISNRSRIALGNGSRRLEWDPASLSLRDVS